MSSNNNSSNLVEGSQTISITDAPPVLSLRSSSTSNKVKSSTKEKEASRSNVRWEQGTVDNENMGKKKTKICCIFHPQNEDDEDAEPEVHFHDRPSDSDSSSSGESEDDNAKGYNFEERRRRRLERRHKKLQENSAPEPNAYEFQPDYTNRRNNNNELNV